MKRVALFGATGSIGMQTLDVMKRLGGFRVEVMSAGTQWEKLARVALEWNPKMVTIANDEAYTNLKQALTGRGIEVIAGGAASSEAAAKAEYDLCVNAFVGVAGLMPSYHALNRGIDLALANKESLVLAGDLLNQLATERDASIIPIDSEHSAILQCLRGEDEKEVKRLIITASGGPFREWPLEKIRNATPEEALNHPTWKMGAKITIDSATLLNKGLEIIEAYHLFHIPPERITPLIHPVSIVHSMVEFSDGSIKAQLGSPDMRIPIQYALNYPAHNDIDLELSDPAEWPALEFFEIDMRRYPCLDLAYQALQIGGTATAVLNGADEAAVERFLNGDFSFGEIADSIAEALNKHEPSTADSLEAIFTADDFGRKTVNSRMKAD